MTKAMKYKHRLNNRMDQEKSHYIDKCCHWM